MHSVSKSYSYVLYVDEAGDDGTKTFRPENPNGSTEWLCLSGFLVRSRVDEALPAILAEIMSDINCRARSLHYRELSDTKRKRACEMVAGINSRAFVVCSYKRTMQGHNNPRAALKSGGTNQYLYNWLIRLLLERATDFIVNDKEFDDGNDFARIVFSHRGGHRFGQMKAYIEQLRYQATARSTFIRTREIRPKALRFVFFDQVPHFQMAGLQIADVIASAFFQGLETSSPRWSVAPACALSRIMASETIAGNRKVIPDYGVTLVPRPHLASLQKDQRELFERYGYRFDDKYRFR